MTNGRGDPNNATLFINLDAVPRRLRVQQHGLCGGDRLAAVRDRAGPRAPAVRVRAAVASTTPAATDDHDRASARDGRGPRPRLQRPRPGRAKSYRRFLGRSMLLMIALVIVGAYLLPLLYMVTTAFQQPGQSTDARRARLAGGAADGRRTRASPTPSTRSRSRTATTRQLIAHRAGPRVQRVRGPGRLPTPTPIEWQGRWRTLEQAWTFAPLVENFSTAWNQLEFPRLLLQHVRRSRS